jgi:glycine cleavage system H protein
MTTPGDQLDFPAIVTDAGDAIAFRRCGLALTLPKSYRYTAAHYWLAHQAEPATWRIGFTAFAVRMLGDFVEFHLDPQPGETIQLGQTMGNYEGLKAVTELYSAVDGSFLRANPALAREGDLTRSDPHGVGWLYEARGAPDPASLDVHGYLALLNVTLDRLRRPPA